jgi:hypothetical protein
MGLAVMMAGVIALAKPAIEQQQLEQEQLATTLGESP